MARKKRKLATPPPSRHSKSWAVVGVDISLSAIAGACFGYDDVLKQRFGVGLHTIRWNQGEHYFERMRQAAKAEGFIHSLMVQATTAPIPHGRIFIAVEEPWPMGLVKKMESSWLKQQAQISGSFLGGLVRFRFPNIYEVNVMSWRKIVIDETGIGKPTKFDIKEWAIQAYGLPDLPDLINSKHGKISRPETSRAKAVQPQDVYDAVGVMVWMENELIKGDVL